MLAQIIQEHDPGVLNSNLAESTAKVIRGGSWKKQRIVVVLPAADTIPTKVALSHWSLMFPPNQPVHRMLALGCEVGDAYSRAISEILAHPDLSQWEYLLTIEHDNAPPPDGVIKLIKHMEAHPEYAWISGCYWLKGLENPVCQIWGDYSDPVVNFRPQPPRAGELVPCWGTGMGFALWRMSMFKDERLHRPWFETHGGDSGRGVGTQDLVFANDAAKHGYRCAVACDVLVGHYDHEGKFGPAGMMY